MERSKSAGFGWRLLKKNVILEKPSLTGLSKMTFPAFIYYLFQTTSADFTLAELVPR